jgi:hypothetical protein
LQNASNVLIGKLEFDYGDDAHIMVGWHSGNTAPDA